MGSYDSTCSVSSLPLSGGDPVRWLLLVRSPYGRAWEPRTWPIRAHYNSYGSIDTVEEGSIRDVIFHVLQEDLLEMGVGDNSYHDVAVRKNMDFDDLLMAIHEGRLFVGEMSWEERERRHAREKLPDYIPTLQNVESALGGVTGSSSKRPSSNSSGNRHQSLPVCSQR